DLIGEDCPNQSGGIVELESPIQGRRSQDDSVAILFCGPEEKVATETMAQLSLAQRSRECVTNLDSLFRFAQLKLGPATLNQKLTLKSMQGRFNRRINSMRSFPACSFSCTKSSKRALGSSLGFSSNVSTTHLTGWAAVQKKRGCSQLYFNPNYNQLHF
ncbi:unnamed protein product, partial [Protopolystoma xenopodis]